MRFFVDQIADRLFEIERRSLEMLATLDDATLYLRPEGSRDSLFPFSCGEYIVRSAATIEKTFGGITTRLWDDPFEWTLPEKLSTIESVTKYLDEVAATRDRGLAFLTSDDDLKRMIPAPEELRSLANILLDTIAASEQLLGKAEAFREIIQAVSKKSAEGTLEVSPMR